MHDVHLLALIAVLLAVSCRLITLVCTSTWCTAFLDALLNGSLISEVAGSRRRGGMLSTADWFTAALSDFASGLS